MPKLKNFPKHSNFLWVIHQRTIHYFWVWWTYFAHYAYLACECIRL